MLKPRVIVTATLLAAASCGGPQAPAAPVETTHQVVVLDKSASTRVHLTMGAGELEVKGGASDLLTAEFSYSVPAWKRTVSDRTSGTEREVEVVQGSESGSGGPTKNHWQVALNDSMPMDVIAHLGAGEAHVTLGSLSLRRVELQMGAGEVELDLRGHPSKNYTVELRGGVGSATVRLPASVAISATASGGLGSINVTGLEKRDNRWVNARAGTSPVTIDLDVKGGVGEITIIAE